MTDLHPAVRQVLADRLAGLQSAVAAAEGRARGARAAAEAALQEWQALKDEKRAIQQQLSEDARDRVAASPYAGHPDQATPGTPDDPWMPGDIATLLVGVPERHWSRGTSFRVAGTRAFEDAQTLRFEGVDGWYLAANYARTIRPAAGASEPLPAGAADYAGTDQAAFVTEQPGGVIAQERAAENARVAADQPPAGMTGAPDAARPAQRAQHGDGATPAERATVHPEGEPVPPAERASVAP